MSEDINLNQVRYSIVTPVRNEEPVIDQTVRSVINQTLRPKKWVILNDGSTDRTGEILESYAARFDWIEVIHAEKKVACYKGVQEILGLAFDRIDIEQNDFIGKLDADIELGPSYYEDIMKKFYGDPGLGIAGGTLFHIANGKKVMENDPEYHVRGGLKFYRIQCWNDIGGIEFKLGYDTIDEIKAAMLGWKTRHYGDIKALHHRPTGQQKGFLGSFSYQGKMAYLVGYHPLFLICRSLKDMTSRPYVLGGIAEIVGFFSCYLNRTERSIDDQEFIKFLRKMQIKRLLLGLSSIPLSLCL